MRAALEFDLSIEADELRYFEMLKARKMLSALIVIRDAIRQMIKHGIPLGYELTPEDFIQERFCEAVIDYGLEEFL